MALITVITPTYNRAEQLKKLFQSLSSQTSNNFEWLVVDDGSTDHTAEAANEMMQSANFRMRYIHKENGGKHTALNAGIKTITSELTFIVDSDDDVLPDGIATIERYYLKYKDEPDVGIWAFLRQSRSKGIILKMPHDEYVGDYAEERIRKNRPGDLAEVFLTKALREFPFPEFQGERFLSEDVVWIPLGQKYRSVFINLPIYLCDYLQGGLTHNDKILKFASPLGSMLRGKMLMRKECGFKAKIRGAIIYDCYRREVRTPIPESVELEKISDKIMVAFLHPAGAWFNRRWRKD